MTTSLPPEVPLPDPAPEDADHRGETARLPETRGLWATAFRELTHKRSARIGMAMLAVLLLIAIFAPLIAPYGPNDVLLGKEEVAPRDPPCVHLFGCDDSKPQHILGNDGNGRDELSRLIYGARVPSMPGIERGAV